EELAAMDAESDRCAVELSDAGVDVLAFSLLLAALHAALGLLWFAALVAATRPLSRWLARPSVARGLDRLSAGVFIAFGLKLALERR
ncbi:hypothetical protein WLU62_08900, partial [Bordetella bronchiseptica]